MPKHIILVYTWTRPLCPPPTHTQFKAQWRIPSTELCWSSTQACSFVLLYIVIHFAFVLMLLIHNAYIISHTWSSMYMADGNWKLSSENVKRFSCCSMNLIHILCILCHKSKSDIENDRYSEYYFELKISFSQWIKTSFVFLQIAFLKNM